MYYIEWQLNSVLIEFKPNSNTTSKSDKGGFQKKPTPKEWKVFRERNITMVCATPSGSKN